jgi:hypothetical protein
MRRRFSLRELIVVLVMAAIVGAIGVRMLAAHRWETNRTACASNLRALWQSQYNYAARYGTPEGTMPAALGCEFHLLLQRGPQPLINRYEPFFCPLTGDAIGPGRTSYRGPAWDVNLGLYGAVSPVSADREGNHGPGRGGNLLTNLGDVLEVEENDSLWIRARTTTRD